MSASESLNEILFHGTSRRFKAGDVILPPEKTGVAQNWGAKSKNDPKSVYATDDLPRARYYANVSTFNNKGTDPSAQSRVYQVEPVNPQEARWQVKKFAGGAGGSSSTREHVSSEGYRVVKRVWIKKK